MSLLNAEPDIYIVGEAADGEEMVEKFELLNPALVLADISMPKKSGIEAASEIRGLHPDAKIIFITMLTGEDVLYSAVKSGAMGLVTKGSARGELLYAIREVSEGRRYFGPLYPDEKIAELLEKFSHPENRNTSNLFDDLTLQEKSVLEYIAEGKGTSEIAEAMEVGKRAVESYRYNINKKRDLKSQHALFLLAIKYSEYKKLHHADE